MRAAATRGSARSREILAGAVRAGLLQKIDPISGECVGHRPLGLVEKGRCLIWACVMAAMQEEARQVLHDAAARGHRRVADAAVDNAETESSFAASSSSRPPATAAAPPPPSPPSLPPPLLPPPPLPLARRPFKYVTNWCFSPKGTETLVHLVRGWGESMPTEGHPR